MSPDHDKTPKLPANEPDRFEKKLERLKAKLEAVDALFENLIIGLRHELSREMDLFDNPLLGESGKKIRTFLEERVLLVAESYRQKRINDFIQRIDEAIQFYEQEIKVQHGGREDIDMDDPMPPQTPPAPSKKPKK